MTRVGTCGVESRSEVSGKCEPGSTWLGLRGYRCSPVGMDSDMDEVQEQGEDSAFVWFREEDDLEARRRWPMWVAGLAVDEPFAERAARMERSLRSRRADGDGPIVVCGSPSSSAEVEGTA